MSQDISKLILIIFILLWVIVLYFVIRDTKNKEGKFGINLKYKDMKCPKCNKMMPFPRLPKSIYQALTEIRTCPNCKCEMDKWGKEISKKGDN